MLYDTIYDFFLGIFNSSNISGYATDIMGISTTMPVWLSHTATITTLVLLVIFLGLVVRWIFRVFAGVIKAF